LNNEAAAELISDAVGTGITTQVKIGIPEGVGQVITSSGEVVPVTEAIIVPMLGRPGQLVRSAYPILPGAFPGVH
jgi:hypothetical protein